MKNGEILFYFFCFIADTTHIESVDNKLIEHYKIIMIALIFFNFSESECKCSDRHGPNELLYVIKM